ncbi:unnamed protein product [Didymodactylos carnosus]|uniref:BPTI/Kunitz inhibitor domain-containing protein n=1 Tax=Didymodactylos carnosus TaxID=1234261 RepID=A0A815GPD8_9BILA|nr:unnamed protein product [Didymodactylos carnosus]CAF1342771.1 unnamed protein product [Didymodactylos carnosus]CAF3988292.1 unnamed protein product [Didymodactylos carnosus]CAF4205290.1 unnamed protein product [Didymodactylos carnosus]
MAILCGTDKKCQVVKNCTTGDDCTYVGQCVRPKRDIINEDGKKGKNICKQPPISGHCVADFRRFYYNSTTRTCESFVYGGCGGNENNFTTREACIDTCKE